MSNLLEAIRADDRIALVAKHLIDLAYAKEDRQYARDKDRADPNGSDQFYYLIEEADQALEDASNNLSGLEANAYELMFAMAIVADEKRLRSLLEDRLSELYGRFCDGPDDYDLWSKIARLGWTETEIARLDIRKIPFCRLRDAVDGCYGKWKDASHSAAAFLDRIDAYDEPARIYLYYWTKGWHSNGGTTFVTTAKDFNAAQAEIDRRIVEGDLDGIAPRDWTGYIAIDATEHAGCEESNHDHKTFEEIRARHLARQAA